MLFDTIIKENIGLCEWIWDTYFGMEGVLKKQTLIIQHYKSSVTNILVKAKESITLSYTETKLRHPRTNLELSIEIHENQIEFQFE